MFNYEIFAQRVRVRKSTGELCVEKENALFWVLIFEQSIQKHFLAQKCHNSCRQVPLDEFSSFLFHLAIF